MGRSDKRKEERREEGRRAEGRRGRGRIEWKLVIFSHVIEIMYEFLY